MPKMLSTFNLILFVLVLLGCAIAAASGYVDIKDCYNEQGAHTAYIETVCPIDVLMAASERRVNCLCSLLACSANASHVLDHVDFEYVVALDGSVGFTPAQLPTRPGCEYTHFFLYLSDMPDKPANGTCDPQQHFGFHAVQRSDVHGNAVFERLPLFKRYRARFQFVNDVPADVDCNVVSALYDIWTNVTRQLTVATLGIVRQSDVELLIAWSTPEFMFCPESSLTYVLTAKRNEAPKAEVNRDYCKKLPKLRVRPILDDYIDDKKNYPNPAALEGDIQAQWPSSFENLEVADHFNEFYDYYVALNISHDVDSWQLRDLRHYSVYTIAVGACCPDTANCKECCSLPKLGRIQTTRKENADRVRNLTYFHYPVTLEHWMEIFWEPPSAPNAEVVAYTCTLQSLTNTSQVIFDSCLTPAEHADANNGDGVRILDIPCGVYALSVRTYTLAGPGPIVTATLNLEHRRAAPWYERDYY